MTVGPLEPHFRGQGAKMSNRLQKGKWSSWIAVSKTVTVWVSVEALSENCYPNVTQNKHVYAICGQPEVAGDISIENV